MKYLFGFIKKKKLSRIITYFLIALSISLLGILSYLFIPSKLNISGDNDAKKIYFADHISDAYRDVIKEFNQKYKGRIEVIPVHLPFEKFTTNERKELLTRYLRSKNDRIDIFAIDQIWVPRFAKWAAYPNNVLSKIVRDSILDVPAKTCYYDGKLVAVPLYTDVGLLYYRKDLLEKINNYKILEKKLKESVTWDDFINLSTQLPGYNPYYIFQADDYEGLVCSFIELLSEQNKELYENNKLTLQSSEAKRALTLLVDLVNRYHVSPEVVTQLRENSSNNYFIENDGIFLRGWPSFIREVNREFNGSEKIKQINMAAIPHFKGCKPVSIIGGWNLMVSKYSEKKTESMEFLEFMLSKSTQRKLYEKGGYVPVASSIYNDPVFLAKSNNLQFYYKLIDHGVLRPSLENYTRISDILSYYIYLAIKKKISVDEALLKATEMINSGQILIR